MAVWVNRSHARVNNRSPRALGICDRCGGLWNHYKLRWQVEWAGSQIQNLRQLVCPECYDIPNEQLRSIIIPPDPVPIQNPRIEPFASDESSLLATQNGLVITTQDGTPISINIGYEP